jgi:hypothetical protein
MPGFGPCPFDPMRPEIWHLRMAMSYSGLRIAECGYSVLPFELVEQRPFGDVHGRLPGGAVPDQTLGASPRFREFGFEWSLPIALGMATCRHWPRVGNLPSDANATCHMGSRRQDDLESQPIPV